MTTIRPSKPSLRKSRDSTETSSTIPPLHPSRKPSAMPEELFSMSYATCRTSGSARRLTRSRHTLTWRMSKTSTAPSRLSTVPRCLDHPPSSVQMGTRWSQTRRRSWSAGQNTSTTSSTARPQSMRKHSPGCRRSPMTTRSLTPPTEEEVVKAIKRLSDRQGTGWLDPCWDLHLWWPPSDRAPYRAVPVHVARRKAPSVIQRFVNCPHLQAKREQESMRQPPRHFVALHCWKTARQNPAEPPQHTSPSKTCYRRASAASGVDAAP